MIVRKLIHDSKESSQIVSINAANDDHVVIKSQYSMVSVGTERLVSSGQVDNRYFESMKVPHMEGDFNLPCTYGYSLVGEYYSNKSLKTAVHLLHPHQDYAFVNPSEISEIPPFLEAFKATFASNMETAINAVWDAEIKGGEEVVVAGMGSVGVFTAFCLKEVFGCRVYFVEKNKHRANIANQLGFKTWNNSMNPEVIFNTTAAQEVLQWSIENVRKDGKVIEMSWYGTKEVSLNLGGEFHFGRKKIISSQVSSISTQKPNYNYQKRKDLVFELLSNPFFDLLPVNFISFEDSPQFFKYLRKGSINDIFNIIKY